VANKRSPLASNRNPLPSNRSRLASSPPNPLLVSNRPPDSRKLPKGVHSSQLRLLLTSNG
jgi:hypothetical protein